MSIDAAYRAGMLEATGIAEKRTEALRDTLRAVEAECDMLKKRVAELEAALLTFCDQEKLQNQDRTEAWDGSGTTKA